MICILFYNVLFIIWRNKKFVLYHLKVKIQTKEINFWQVETF